MASTEKRRVLDSQLIGGPVMSRWLHLYWIFTYIVFHRQVGISDLGQDDVYDIFGDISSRGLSRESLKKLPQFVVTDQVQATFGENLPCTICLQVQLSE